jgi:hypothetical protein
VSFAAHVALLDHVLTHRPTVVDRIERSLLNVRDKPLSKSRNRAAFAQVLDRCIWDLPGLPADWARLKGALARRHRADGFEPVQLDAFTNELDPLELVVRAYGQWDATRWPGAAGRLAFAETIFAVAMIRELEHLSLRIWDDGHDRAGEGLASIQTLLDRLNAAAAGCVLVRDAPWLINTALGPFTKHLAPYFAVANHIAASLPDDERLRVHAAGVVLAGGHLRSQLRYRMWQTHLPLDAAENVVFTRNSNALDAALLVRDLVPLLRAYTAARPARPGMDRRDLADVILQGLAADPDLFVARLDLLAPYTFIEDLFVDAKGPRPAYSELGTAQVRLLDEFGRLLGAAAADLGADAGELAPARVRYSPLAMTYGFCADLMSNMAMDTLVGQPAFGLSLDDMFVTHVRHDDKLARVRGWQRLPRRPGEREHVEYSAEFADRIFAWLLDALDQRAARPGAANASRRPSSRLFVTTGSARRRHANADAGVGAPFESDPAEAATPADDYRLDTNPTRAGATGGVAWSAVQMRTDRLEGRLLASAEIDGAWTGISKMLLTRLTGQGADALLTHTARAVIDVLHLACPGLVVDVSPAEPDGSGP